MAARVQVIAQMLVEHPAAFGRPLADRDAWQTVAAGPHANGAISRAEQMISAPVPELSDTFYSECALAGDRTKCGPVLKARHERLPAFALAECIENRGRFLAPLEEAIRLVCAETTWLHPAHDRKLRNVRGEVIEIDLNSAAQSWQMATAYYWLKEKLTPETRKLVRAELERRTLIPFEGAVNEGKPKLGWLATTSNWNAVCLAGVTGAALAVIESPQRRAFFVAAAERYSENFLSGFPADGYCTEGLGYWNYGFGHYVLLAEAVYQATRGQLDLLTRPAAKEPAQFGARIEIMNGVYPAFADCTVGTRPDRATMWYVNRRLGLGLQRWEAQYPPLGRHGLFITAMYAFPNAASDVVRAEATQLDIEPRSWFADAGILLCRPGSQTSCRLGAALKGGHNAEHHNHNDVGSYVVAVGAQQLIIDPGPEVYTGRTFSKDRYVSNLLNSFGHSVPRVAGKLQKPGRDAQARVLRTEFSEETDTLVLDLSAAYDVTGMTRLERTFVYSRQDAGTLTVTDRVAFTEPRDFGTAIVTLGKPRETEPGELLIEGTEQAVSVTVEAEGGEIEITTEQIDADARTPRLPTRIGINLMRPVTQAAVTVTIRPADLALPLLRNGGFEDGDWTWSIPKDGMGSVSAEHPASGTAALKIVDRSAKLGSNISSARIPIHAPGVFELRGKVRHESGAAVGLYVRYLDAEGRLLNERTNDKGWIASVAAPAGPAGQWVPFAARFTPPADTAFLQLWIHSGSTARSEACLDDLDIVSVDADGP